MDQVVTTPTETELARIEAQREWVRGHYEPDAQYKYQSLDGKLRLLRAIIESGWIEKTETVKLQSLGIALGDALAQELSLEWVTVEDEYGRDPALRVPGTTVLLFPLTMISKRIEHDEHVDVDELFLGACETARSMTAEPRYQSAD